MTEYIVICIFSLLGSCLTLFSGFGLGTILIPVFGFFFPIELAIALTAIVHFLNNLFKLALLGKFADKKVILQFGIPAILFAFLGAHVLSYLTDLKPICQYSFSGNTFFIMPLKLTVAVLIAVFALFETIPQLVNLKFDKKYLPLGGILSGFFGGLSGHQGALRSTFLLRLGLTKESFIATGVVIACLIDVSRLTVYSKQITNATIEFNYTLIIAATLSAFVGAYFGNKFLKKITLKNVQIVVSIMLFVFAVLLGGGLI